MDAQAPTAAVAAGVRRPARLLRRASDERLVALVRDGDEAAFEVLFDRHHRAILGFCRHMLGSREEAEDAVQHTFLAAYRDLLGSDKPIELRAWLFAIARNRCLSILRARREHIALEDAEPSTAGLTATVEQREDLRELLADVARLPEDQRAALLLAELGALDHAGIARVLGCPREKVKALVFQARSSLAASREARATPCEQIRMELASASGGALRRGPLRRHLRECAGCRAFKDEVATQRKLFALALPVIPTAALKAGALPWSAALGGGSGSGAAGAGAAGAGAGVAGTASGGGAVGGFAGALASTGAAKVAVSLAVAGAVAGGGALTLEARHDATPASTQQAPARSTPVLPAGGAPGLGIAPRGTRSGSTTRGFSGSGGLGLGRDEHAHSPSGSGRGGSKSRSHPGHPQAGAGRRPATRGSARAPRGGSRNAPSATRRNGARAPKTDKTPATGGRSTAPGSSGRGSAQGGTETSPADPSAPATTEPLEDAPAG